MTNAFLHETWSKAAAHSIELRQKNLPFAVVSLDQYQ